MILSIFCRIIGLYFAVAFLVMQRLLHEQQQLNDVRRATQLDHGFTVVSACILYNDLKMFAHKVQAVHQLLPVHRETYMTYPRVILTLNDEVPNFL